MDEAATMSGITQPTAGQEDQMDPVTTRKLTDLRQGAQASLASAAAALDERDYAAAQSFIDLASRENKQAWAIENAAMRAAAAVA